MQNETKEGKDVTKLPLTFSALECDWSRAVPQFIMFLFICALNVKCLRDPAFINVEKPTPNYFFIVKWLSTTLLIYCFKYFVSLKDLSLVRPHISASGNIWFFFCHGIDVYETDEWFIEKMHKKLLKITVTKVFKISFVATIPPSSLFLYTFDYLKTWNVIGLHVPLTRF